MHLVKFIWREKKRKEERMSHGILFMVKEILSSVYYFDVRLDTMTDLGEASYTFHVSQYLFL